MTQSPKLAVLAALVAAAVTAGCGSSSTDPSRANENADNTATASTSSSTGADRAPPSQDIRSRASREIQDPDTLYKSWPKPDLVLFLTGQQHGYIEPCGCTGLDNQKGGLARRHTLARELSDQGWPLLAIDAGNQVRRSGKQAEIKFQVTLDGMNSIGYEAVTFGVDDLKLSSDHLAATTATVDGQETPYVCANAAIFAPDLTRTHKIVERGGQKVGITGVIGDSWLAEVKSDDVIRKPASEALKEVLPKLKDANCDLYVLLAHATIEESQSLAREFPEFQIVVTAGGEGDPTFQPERVGPHEALLVRVGVKGMHVGLVGVYTSGEPRFRYQRLPLSAEFDDSPQMLELLAAYQTLLQDEGLSGLGIKPLPHPTGRQFVGSQVCADCHETEHQIWEDSPHAKATDSLVDPIERADIKRHFDPECLSCHVTGWNPQRFNPYESGYLGLDESPLMHGSGCENCHGPGSSHVAAESGEVDATEDQLEKLRQGMQLTLERAKEEHCMQCHDLDNSPDFHDEGAFQTFWQKIEH